jgi:NAD(P)-dependent dehydrogenase (short-subunit alcohol dehydrogenase family)
VTIEPAQPLADRVAIVTGGSRGLGLEMATAFAQAGADVVIASRNADELNAALKEILAGTGRQGHAIAADLSKRPEAARLAKAAEERFGRVDILVNNAGVNRTGPTLEVTEETWDQIQDTNVKGMFFACQAVGPHMMARRRGKIINIGSIISAIGLGHNVPYAASKGAVWQLTRSLALEWAGHNIQVNAIGPGYVLTDQVRWLFRQPEFAEKILRKQPTGRVADVTDLDGTVLFLASAASDYVNGQMIFVDGASAAGWVGPE